MLGKGKILKTILLNSGKFKIVQYTEREQPFTIHESGQVIQFCRSIEEVENYISSGRRRAI